jgi:hypothetical protein
MSAEAIHTTYVSFDSMSKLTEEMCKASTSDSLFQTYFNNSTIDE